MGFYTNDCLIVFYKFINSFGLRLGRNFDLWVLLFFLCGCLSLCGAAAAAFHCAIQGTILSSKQYTWIQQYRVGLDVSKQCGSHNFLDFILQPTCKTSNRW